MRRIEQWLLCVQHCTEDQPEAESPSDTTALDR